MRRSLITTIILVAVAATGSLFAQQKIGVIDLAKLQSQTKEGKRIRTRIQATAKQKQAKIDGMKARAQDLQRKLQDPKISNDKKDEYANQLNQLQYEAQATAKAADDELRAKQNKEMGLFKEKVLSAVAEVAKSMGLDFVIPKGSTLYNKMSSEITNQVITKMNAMYP